MQICHAGDALADSATVEGGFAGLVVDLFGEGRVIAELQQVSKQVWVLIGLHGISELRVVHVTWQNKPCHASLRCTKPCCMLCSSCTVPRMCYSLYVAPPISQVQQARASYHAGNGISGTKSGAYASYGCNGELLYALVDCAVF